MDIAVKLTLVASVVLIGYNLSQILSSYEHVCKKVSDFKTAAAETKSEDKSVKQSNFLLISILSTVYFLLNYFAGFDYWILGIIASKLMVTGFLSSAEVDLILKTGAISRKFFKIGKIDEFLNILLGLGVALILVM